MSLKNLDASRRLRWLLPTSLLALAIITHAIAVPTNWFRSAQVTGTIIPAPPGPNAFHFLAWIDGSDWLYIQGNEVWYVHRNYQYPGIHPPCPPEGHPTYINDDPWYPEWPDDWGYDDYGQRSLNTYTNLYPPLLEIATLKVIQARHSISLVQYPSIQNDYTAIILLDDDPLGGAAWYEFELSYTSPLSATIDVDPNTLNLASRGRWITAYIQLPEGYDAMDINATTILLNGTILPVLDPKYEFVTNPSKYIVDHDGDGILERMVKFNRTEVASWVYIDLGTEYGNVTLAITGELFDRTPFEGTDSINVLLPGDVNLDGTVDIFDALLLVASFWSTLGESNWKPECDINEDKVVDIFDALIVRTHFGESV